VEINDSEFALLWHTAVDTDEESVIAAVDFGERAE
jgi:hypothetical protein